MFWSASLREGAAGAAAPGADGVNQRKMMDFFILEGESAKEKAADGPRLSLLRSGAEDPPPFNV